MQVGDIIVALDDTDEGFKEGQICLVHTVDDDDGLWNECYAYDVYVLKAFTSEHAYFGEPADYCAATRIEEPDNFKIIGKASALGALGIAPMNYLMEEAIHENRA